MTDIMIISNESYAPHIFRMLNTLFTNHSRPMRVFLFYSDLSEHTLKALTVFFDQWNCNEFVPIRIDTALTEGLPIPKDSGCEIYYKLLGLDLLPEDIGSVVCMDLDMVVKGRMDPVFDLDVSTYALAACRDIWGYIYGEEKRNIVRLSLKEGYPYFNAGLMKFNLDRIRDYGGGRKLIEYGYQHKEMLMWPEQDILNKVFCDEYMELPWHMYNCPPVMYVMKVDEVMQGIFSPLRQDEVANINDLSGYADYTQAIADAASVIHYLAETKPWRKGRPMSRTYEIFDAFLEL